MKRSILVSLIVSGVALMGASAANAIGICVTVGTCNSYFFTLGPATSDTFSLTGYEYGCGVNTRQANGVLRRDATDWYLGFTGSNGGNFDYGQQVTWNGTFASNLSGTYEVLYTYMSGGALTAHGTSGAANISVCNDPAVAQQAAGPDASLGE